VSYPHIKSCILLESDVISSHISFGGVHCVIMFVLNRCRCKCTFMLDLDHKDHHLEA
jgi:hypothetical protein